MDERGGEESHACRFFPHGVEWWDRRREKESLAGILFPHMERKIFGDERASCRYGEWCIISHLACWVMTHKCRGSIVVLSISKSVEPNEEQKEMISSFQ